MLGGGWVKKVEPGDNRGKHVLNTRKGLLRIG